MYCVYLHMEEDVHRICMCRCIAYERVDAMAVRAETEMPAAPSREHLLAYLVRHGTEAIDFVKEVTLRISTCFMKQRMYSSTISSSSYEETTREAMACTEKCLSTVNAIFCGGCGGGDKELKQQHSFLRDTQSDGAWTLQSLLGEFSPGAWERVVVRSCLVVIAQPQYPCQRLLFDLPFEAHSRLPCSVLVDAVSFWCTVIHKGYPQVCRLMEQCVCLHHNQEEDAIVALTIASVVLQTTEQMMQLPMTLPEWWLSHFRKIHDISLADFRGEGNGTTHAYEQVLCEYLWRAHVGIVDCEVVTHFRTAWLTGLRETLLKQPSVQVGAMLRRKFGTPGCCFSEWSKWDYLRPLVALLVEDVCRWLDASAVVSLEQHVWSGIGLSQRELALLLHKLIRGHTPVPMPEQQSTLTEGAYTVAHPLYLCSTVARKWFTMAAVRAHNRALLPPWMIRRTEATNFECVHAWPYALVSQQEIDGLSRQSTTCYLHHDATRMELPSIFNAPSLCAWHYITREVLMDLVHTFTTTDSEAVSTPPPSTRLSKADAAHACSPLYPIEMVEFDWQIGGGAEPPHMVTLTLAETLLWKIHQRCRLLATTTSVAVSLQPGSECTLVILVTDAQRVPPARQFVPIAKCTCHFLQWLREEVLTATDRDLCRKLSTTDTRIPFQWTT